MSSCEASSSSSSLRTSMPSTSTAHQLSAATAFDRITDESEIEQLNHFISRIKHPGGGNPSPDHGHSSSRSNEDALLPIKKLLADITYIKQSVDKLKKDDSRTNVLLSDLLSYKSRNPEDFDSDSDSDSKIDNYKKRNFNKLLRIVIEIKLRVCRPLDETKSAGTVDRDNAAGGNIKNEPSLGETKSTGTVDGDNAAGGNIENEPSAFPGEEQLHSSCAYESLNLREKLCLLSLAIFPWHVDRVAIKRRVLAYWWVGEGFIDPITTSTDLVDQPKTIEEIADEILRVLTEKGFVEPVVRKGLVSDTYIMHPVVRSVVVSLAKRDGIFDIDDKGDLEPDFSRSKRALLIKPQGKSPSSLQVLNQYTSGRRSSASNLKKLELVQTLFNVEESFLDIRSEWFFKMKNLGVLNLGQWSCDPLQLMQQQHIELKEPKVLVALKNMKELRVLSLQGVSMIIKLPDEVCKLVNLIVLDLRSCHDLEELPRNIGSLKNLTHLDVSKCHRLRKMPVQTAWLSKLEVLKGFVISNFNPNRCNTFELTKLRKLRKLSVIVKREGKFPLMTELNHFKAMKQLRKLSISWQKKKLSNGFSSAYNVRCDMRRQVQNSKKHGLLLDHLHKLDLLGMPYRRPPAWLVPSQLKSLKKLYFRGGKLRRLGNSDAETERWKVQTLRLKFLQGMDINWYELSELFPDLKYLEKYECPMLASFPCDHDGVWKTS